MRSVKSVEFVAPSGGRYAEILTPEAVAFVVGLQRNFQRAAEELLEHEGAARRGWMRGAARFSEGNKTHSRE